MNEIIAAILGALLGGPIGYLMERFLSRPRFILSYARVEFENVIILTSESYQALTQLIHFVDWMDSQVPWNFKQSAQGNLFTRDEARILRDLGEHYINLQKVIVARVKPRLITLNSGNGEEIEKEMFELAPDYYLIFNRQLIEDYHKDAAGTIEQLKTHLEATVNNIEEKAVPLLMTVVKECKQHINRGRGTSDRLIVRVGIGNRGIQDGLIEAEASLQAVNRVFRLPVKLTKRPWYTEDENEGTLDSSYLRLPARSFRVMDFIIDESLNAHADLDRLRRVLRNGTRATFTAHKLGHRKATSMKFEARLPE